MYLCNFHSKQIAQNRQRSKRETISVNRNRIWIYIGVYTNDAGKGIYRYDLDLASGKLTYGQLQNGPTTSADSSLAAESDQPSFLAVHPKSPLLFCVNELCDYEGLTTGTVSAFKIELKSGRLALLNRQSSLGSAPCYLAVDPSGRCLLVANYTGGSVTCFPICPDGRLDEATSFFQHRSSGVHPTRQLASHAHSIKHDPAGRFAFVPDLGQDKIFVYRLDAEKCLLVPNDPPFVDLPPGAGPRHIVFSQDARFAYAINELASTLTTFQYNAQRGSLAQLEEISTLPASYSGENTAAEVALHPSGRFLYCSNRGHDSIAVFAVDRKKGTLEVRGHQPAMGQWPRHFCITPNGGLLLVANQYSDNISVFRIDANAGDLCLLSSSLKISNPVCLLPTRVY